MDVLSTPLSCDHLYFIIVVMIYLTEDLIFLLGHQYTLSCAGANTTSPKLQFT